MAESKDKMSKIISIEKQRISDLENRLDRIQTAVAEATWYMKIGDTDLSDLCEQIGEIMTGYAPTTDEQITPDDEVVKLRAIVLEQNNFINRLAMGIANALNETVEEGEPLVILETLVRIINERALKD